MIVVGNGDQAQTTACGLFNYARRAGPAIAEVGMHVDIGTAVTIQSR